MRRDEIVVRETLGLTDDEIDILSVDRWCDAKAREVVDLYNMARALPQDPGARGLFDAALADWRQARAARPETPNAQL